MALWAKLLAKVLDIDLDESEIDSTIEVTYTTEADFQGSGIVEEDGSHIKINLQELDKRTEGDLYGVNDRSAPRCYRCLRLQPEFIWHNRYYCRGCVIRRDVLTEELSPSILKEEYEVGIIVLKDNSRFPFRWDDDVLWKFRGARIKGDLFTVVDIEGGEVSVLPSFVKAIKKPHQLRYFEWSEPQYKKPKIKYKAQEG